jgi:hypothetical protein
VRGSRSDSLAEGEKSPYRAIKKIKKKKKKKVSHCEFKDSLTDKVLDLLFNNYKFKFFQDH